MDANSRPAEGDEVTVYAVTGGREGAAANSPLLYGVRGVILGITDWGAYVRWTAGGRVGVYRAAWGEIVPAGRNGAVGGLNGAIASPNGVSAGGEGVTALRRPRPPRNMAEGLYAASNADDRRSEPRAKGEGGQPGLPNEPNGEVCGRCGGGNMTRAGTCLLCLDCGDTSGGCG